jgi:hypothetical protein
MPVPQATRTLVSRQAFGGGSLGLRCQYVYELLQGRPVSLVKLNKFDTIFDHE